MAVLWKRVIAVVLAAALVGGAVWFRARDSGTSDPGEAARVVVCTTELETACRAAAATHDDIELRVEPAGITLSMLTGETGDNIAGWVTLAPWPEAVDAQRSFDRRTALFGTSTDIASSALLLTAPADRLPPLLEYCSDTALWRCVGDVTDRSWSSIGGESRWGNVVPGLPDPTTWAFGGVAFADVVGDYLGLDEYARNDWEAQDEFRPWVARLKRSIPSVALQSPSPIDVLLTRPTINVAPATGAELAAKEPDGERASGVSTGGIVTAAVAVVDGASIPARFIDDVGGALRSEGWDPAPVEPPPRVSGGTLLGLLALWKELR